MMYRIQQVVLFAVIFLFLSSPLYVAAQNEGADRLNSETMTKIIELYNKRLYEESLTLLDSIKAKRDQNLNWYYYYALNLSRLKRYDEAEIYFNTFVTKSDVNNAARGYYFLGLMQFYKGEYEKSVNSLEIAMDLSRESKLDRSIDILIDRSIRYRNYYDSHKKTNLSFLIGYGFDTNVLNLSQELSAENLNGHVINYGASVSYRLIDLYNFVFEPSLTLIDNYTLDRSFKSNSTLQSADALQVLISAPIIFYFDTEESDARYDISVNAYHSYLPISSAKRELYLESYFLKAKLDLDLTRKLGLNFHAVYSSDRSKNFVSVDDDATGSRSDAELTLIDYFDKAKESLSGLQYSLSYSLKNSTGVNAKYRRTGAGFGYFFPSFKDTSSSLRIGYEHLFFPEKAVPRKDNQYSVEYAVNKELDEYKNVSFVLGAGQNFSDVELYKYTDLRFSIVYTQNFAF